MFFYILVQSQQMEEKYFFRIVFQQNAVLLVFKFWGSDVDNEQIIKQRTVCSVKTLF